MSVFYIIASPIGNLEDISERAKRILGTLTLIFCEDTRVTRKLLAHLQIRGVKLLSCNEHNEKERSKLLLETLDAGEDVALLSDAGTPLISDPGKHLLRGFYDNPAGQKHKILAIPGASSLTAALSLCPIDSSRFVFEGFLPHGPKQRRRVLRNLAEERALYPRTLVFFESPHRFKKTLIDLASIFGEDINIFVAREITKLYEETYYGTIKDIQERINQQFPQEVQGELVLVI